MRICASCRSRLLEDWFGLLTQAVAPRDCFEAVGAHAFVVCVSLGVPHRTRHIPSCFPWAHQNHHVENHGFERSHLGRAEADFGT